MTWLLSKIVGNPTVLLVLIVGAFLFGVSSGGSAAWWIQSLRVKNAEQELVDYKQEQVRLEQEKKDAADKQRNEAADRYSKVSKQLAESIEAGDVFKRCVAAGRCGLPRNPSGVCEPTTRRAGAGLSTPDSAHGSRADAVPPAGSDAAINDCAMTTLQLNSLQTDIEAQPGYKE